MSDPTYGLNVALEECLRRGMESWRKGRLAFLDDLKLDALLTHTNHLIHAGQGSGPWRFIRSAVEAHFGQSTNTATGFLLESIQVVLATKVPPARIRWGNNGRLLNKLTNKSGAASIDIQVERGGVQWIISCKNSKITTNASSARAQSDDAQAMLSRMATGQMPIPNDPLVDEEEPLLEELPEGDSKERITVLLVAYGLDERPSKKTLEAIRHPRKSRDRLKAKHTLDMRLVGQSAWYFISGDYNFYLKLTSVVSEGAETYDRQLRKKLLQTMLRLHVEFRQKYVQNSRIDWLKVAKEYSGGTWKNAVLRYPKLEKVVGWLDTSAGVQWVLQHTTSTAVKPPKESVP